MALFLLLAGAYSLGQSRFASYSNDRFFFSIEYPADLRSQPPPSNNDGRTFISSDGKTELRVWAGFNVDNLTLKQRYEEEVGSPGVEVTYKRLLENGFVVSGIAGDSIYYQKTLRRNAAGTDVFYTFTLKYPKAQRKRFDAIVKRIAASFKFDPNADV